MTRTLGSKMTRTLTAAVAAVAYVLAFVAPAAATSRIKDIANFEGVRQNQLIGYGLVVGLSGTGDTLQNTPFTKQSIQAMLERSVWGSGGCVSWYTTKTGKNTTLWPGFTFVYRRLCKQFNAAHYRFATPLEREQPISIGPRASAGMAEHADA